MQQQVGSAGETLGAGDVQGSAGVVLALGGALAPSVEATLGAAGLAAVHLHLGPCARRWNATSDETGLMSGYRHQQRVAWAQPPWWLLRQHWPFLQR